MTFLLEANKLKKINYQQVSLRNLYRLNGEKKQWNENTNS